MCGICGIFAYDSADLPKDDRVTAACQAMRYRGPDSVGFLRRDKIKLGHVRLSIIDIAGGQQPMSNEDGTVHVVYNGEIYNYPALREVVKARGHVLRTRCDTEVLVHLYEDYGRDMVDHLVGEFVFAIWDDRCDYLLLVRDRLGVKPLFYADVGGKLVFASEMLPLMVIGGFPRRLDYSAIRTYLNTKTIAGPRTIYQDVRKLLPGNLMEVKNGRVSVSEYWDLRFEPDESMSETQLAEEVRALVDRSVKGQLMSDVPLGAFLSGGVDSSTVVISMVRANQGQVKTFSIGYKENAYDESRYYKLLARKLGVEHHEFIFEPDLMEILPKLVNHFGQPCAIGSALPLYYLSRLAREHVTVALSGDGGDEVFAGYNTYNFVNYLRMLDNRAGRAVRSKLVGRLLSAGQLRITSVLGKVMHRLRKIHRLVQLPPCLRMPLMGNLPDTKITLLDEPLTDPDLPEYVQAFRRAQSSGDWLWPFLYADVKILLPDHMFCKLDRMTMANSMEGRVPLVDYRLVELAGRIPSRMKLKRGQVKAIVKKAMARRLPREVLTRKKVGFRVPFNEWFRGPLRDMAWDILTDRSFKESGIFREKAVATLLERHMSEIANCGGEILELVVFEIWRRNIHQATTPALAQSQGRPPRS